MAVRDLDKAHDQKEELSRTAYLQLFAATCKGLSQSGYVRTAWISLQSEFNRLSEELPLHDGLEIGLKLVDLMIGDGEFESAHRFLHSFSQLPQLTELNPEIVQKFAQAWFQVAYESYYETEQAFELARSAGTSQADLAEMCTQLSLLRFLNGNEEPANIEVPSAR